MEYLNAIRRRDGSDHAQVPSANAGGTSTHLAVPCRHQCISQSSSIAIIPQRESQLSQAGAVISKIEGIFESIVDGLASEAGSVSIPYRSRTATARSRPQPGDHQSATAGARTDGVVAFPGRTPHEAKRFGRLYRCLTSEVISFRSLTYSPVCVCSCSASHT